MRLLNKAEKAELVERMVQGERRPDEWRAYWMKNDYIEHAGYYIEVRRPGITREFWYDDETPCPLTDDPAQRRAYFMAQNIRDNFDDFKIGRWHECRRDLQDHGCCSGSYVARPFLCTWEWRHDLATPVFMYDRWQYGRDTLEGRIRVELTPEDVQDLEWLLYGLKEKYEKRLETYWKRYGDKVCAHGYWANR